MKTYNISRYEECGDSLFICLNSTNNPVYLEHFFNSKEKKDIEGTIAKLVAELELMDEAYVAPEPRINKIEETQAFNIKTTDIATAKTAIIAERLEAAKPEEELIEEPIKQKR
jgi:hypothetical protein